MSVSFFIHNSYYNIDLDGEALRQSSAYEQVRYEINRRSSPLLGSTDWGNVKVQCDSLAKGAGIDLLMAGYLAVANFKVEGLMGFANGLELLNACISMQGEVGIKMSSSRKEILDWVNARSVQEIKRLKPDLSFLRDLYRCERYCNQIHRMIEKFQPSQRVDFETVGFALFEHIDRLEAILYVDKQPSPFKKSVLEQSMPLPNRRKIKPYFCTLFITFILLFGTYFLYQWFGVWKYSDVKRVVRLDDIGHVFNTNDWQKNHVKNDLLNLFSSSITDKLEYSIGKNEKAVKLEMQALKGLYPDDVDELGSLFDKKKEKALQDVEKLVKRFKNARKNIMNINNLVKADNLESARRQVKLLEQYSLSLSPIYGRLEYIERLIADEQIFLAQQQIDILSQRLNSLGWKLVELEAEIESKQNDFLNRERIE